MEALNEDRRAAIESEFQDIASLSTQAGTRIIIGQLGYHGHDVAEQVGTMENAYGRAMWLFLNHSGPGTNLFTECVTLARINEMSFRSSKTRKALPRQEPQHDPETCTRLAAAISAIYRRQGRGYRCHVEHYFRPDPHRHCFYAWPEDFATTDLRYEGSALRRHPRKSVFEIAFVFRPLEGVLEISAPGQTREAEALQEAFCRIALGMDRMPRKPDERCFELNGLKRRSFSFPTDPHHGITRVDLTSMRLNLAGNYTRRLTVEHQAPETAETLHDWMDTLLSQETTPLEMFDVSQARLRVQWLPEDGKRARTLTFTVTTPDSTTLKDEPHHLLLKQYLKRWNIAP